MIVTERIYRTNEAKRFNVDNLNEIVDDFDVLKNYINQ